MRVFPSNTGEEATINTGTNVLSLTGTAVRNLRDFSQAVTDGALADTRKVFVTIFLKSDRTNFLIWEATYDDTGQTLTRVEQLEASGTIGNGTTVQVEVGLSKPLLESMMLDLITSSSDAAIAAVANTRYELDISGFSANRNFTLPAPTRAGQVIELFLTTGDTDYYLVPIGDAGITINGGTAATEAFGTGFGRLLNDLEFYRFVSSSTSNWNIDIDGRQKVRGQVKRTSDQTIAASSEVVVQCNVETFNRGVQTDTGGADGTYPYFISPRRSGKYRVTLAARILSIDCITSNAQMSVIANKNGSSLMRFSDQQQFSAGSWSPIFGIHQEHDFVAGDKLQLLLFHNSTAGSETCQASLQPPLIGIEEML